MHVQQIPLSKNHGFIEQVQKWKNILEKLIVVYTHDVMITLSLTTLFPGHFSFHLTKENVRSAILPNSNGIHNGLKYKKGPAG